MKIIIKKLIINQCSSGCEGCSCFLPKKSKEPALSIREVKKWFNDEMARIINGSKKEPLPEPDYEKIYQELKLSPTKADMIAKWEELQKQGFKTSYRAFCHNISRVNKEKIIKAHRRDAGKD